MSSKGMIRLALCLSLVAGYVCVIAPGKARADTVLNLEFNVDGVLPSSQGWTYTGDVAETPAMSVSGGLLHMNTMSSPGTGGYYRQLDGYYDVTQDAIFETRLRANDLGTVTSFGIGFNDRVGPATGTTYVYLQKGSVWFGNDNTSYAFNTLDGAFHTYRLSVVGSSRTYQFSIDGLLVKNGSVKASDNSNESVYFGDGASGANSGVNVDLDYVHYDNGPSALTSVPEPSTLIGAALGLIGLAGYGGWRRLRSRA